MENLGTTEIMIAATAVLRNTP